VRFHFDGGVASRRGRHVVPENNEKTSSKVDIVSTADAASKLVAICIAVFYVCGFLITSLHDFHFGFSEMNPFRPRILTAGAWFGLMLALPFALVRELLKHNLWSSEERWWFKATNLGYVYVISCVFIFQVESFVFDFDVPPISPLRPTWKVVTYSVVTLVALVTLVAVRDKLPKWLKSLLLAIYLGYLLWNGTNTLVGHQRFDASAISLWLMVVGGICLYEMKVREWRPTLGDWPRSLITLLAILSVFAWAYYPHIKSSWGGGALVPVSITLTKDSAALAGQRVSCLLIDETEAGYYVVRTQGQHATFIPRSSVGLLEFGDGSETAWPLQSK
jgi:hypothetical protein